MQRFLSIWQNLILKSTIPFQVRHKYLQFRILLHLNTHFNHKIYMFVIFLSKKQANKI